MYLYTLYAAVCVNGKEKARSNSQLWRPMNNMHFNSTGKVLGIESSYYVAEVEYREGEEEEDEEEEEVRKLKISHYSLFYLPVSYNVWGDWLVNFGSH